MSGPIAFVLKGYPRLSETFIAQEILALEQAGLDIEIVSLRKPTDTSVHPVNREIKAPVRYLPEYLNQERGRVWRAWRAARKLPGYRAARSAWLRDLKRDLTRNRIRRWGQALVLAAELPTGTERLHSHFIHTPASVTRYTSLLLGLPWTCSAHAKDIWTSPDWELGEKLGSADWAVTCTRFGWEHLCDLAADAGRVHLVYHGLDLSRFAPAEIERSGADGDGAGLPVMLLTVGRAVEKKGLDTLLDALARLPEELSWHWHHVGGGELLGALTAQAEALGITDRITWHGSQPQEAVLALYRSADAFVLPCRVAQDGDRDGLPNVFMEAMSQGLPCLSTPVSGVPEIIDNGETGLLVPPDDPDALADALETLITTPSFRAELGRKAEANVRGQFDHTVCIERLLQLFDHPGAPDQARRGAA